MNTKHTPGPWIYEASTRTIRAVPANYWLASMNSFDGAVNHEANARLIAAAPELLAIAGQAVAAFKYLSVCAALKEDRPEFNRRYLAARAAIAKATE